MNFLVDSDICSLYLKGHHRLWTKFQQHRGQIAISTITVAEIAVWASRRNAPASRWAALSSLLTDVVVGE
jgi:predicted nucleic acid-binding protein